MTLIVPAVLGGLAISVMALVSLAAARKKQRPAYATAEARQRILVHDINDDRCTGCDACVAVCPTNVLDLVDNKSRVLRFQDCIQCEQCMWACPTEALVMHLEGTEPPALQVPELDEYFQTAVPGQYLIGEVAGKPLVKNAANLGRSVIEHMLATGMRPGALAGKRAEGSDAKSVSCVDVAIVGSGPAGLSAALTCIQRGLSYVVLEKENLIASTIARYPKGKLVMAEPYDAQNLSLLPVFDSSKEQLIPIWEELIQRTGMRINLKEPVEEVKRLGDGTFSVRTGQGQYRAQRVVLGIGTRGKPRTLGVPGENLPKVSSLLEDPDLHRGQAVLVVGGGDSAVEAAIALADAGAKVIISYRGRNFARAQPKNKSAIESYAAQKRIKIKYQSQVAKFEDDSVVLQMADGSQKRYPNQAAFVLIGADPPIKWLEKLGVHFVERPHQYALGKSDDAVRRFVSSAAACPEDAANAAMLVTGQAQPQQLAVATSKDQPLFPMPSSAEEAPVAVTGPRKWLRAATSVFTSARKLEQPMPLSEFAARSRRKHTGHGRRDELQASERTRVLRMLRDEGGRLADEESRVEMIQPQRGDVRAGSPQDLGPGGRPVPGSFHDEDSAPKQAVIVGLARAMAKGPRTGSKPRRRPSSAPPPIPRASTGEEPTRARPSRRPPPPPGGPAPTTGHAHPAPVAYDAVNAPTSERTSVRPGQGGVNGNAVNGKRVNGSAVNGKRVNGNAVNARSNGARRGPPAPPPGRRQRPASPRFMDAATVHAPRSALDELLQESSRPHPRPQAPAPTPRKPPLPMRPARKAPPPPSARVAPPAPDDFGSDFGDPESTRAADFDPASLMAKAEAPIEVGDDTGNLDARGFFLDEDDFEEPATRRVDVETLMARVRDGSAISPHTEPTRTIDMRARPTSLSDVEWDLD